MLSRSAAILSAVIQSAAIRYAAIHSCLLPSCLRLLPSRLLPSCLLPSRLLLPSLLLSSLLLTSCAGRDTLARGDYQALARELEILARQHLADHQVAGASIVVVDGESALLETGLGQADRALGRATDGNTQYGVGSITKLFTAAAVMRLVDLQKLDIDRPLTAYLPEFSIRSRFAAAGPLTLRSMLTHHSGLPGDRVRGMWGERPERFSALPGLLSDEYVANPPGHSFAYSNLGYSLLGSVIERVGGMPYERFVQAEVLDKVGMTTSGFEPDPAEVARTYDGGRAVVEPRLRDVPAGGLYSTAHDLGRFMRAVLADGATARGALLQAATWREMERPQNAGVALDIDFRIGLGWFLDRDRQGDWRVIGHPGDTINYHSKLVIDRTDAIGVAVLTNSRSGAPVADRLTREALDLVREVKTGHKRSRPEMPEPAPSVAALASEAGVYSTTMGLTRVEPGHNSLRVRAPGLEAEAYPLRDGTFGARISLFGFFPPEVQQLRDVRFAFRDVAGKHVVVAIRHGKALYFGERLAPAPIPDSWRKRLGYYAIANLGDDYAFFCDPALIEQHGFLQIRYRAEGQQEPLSLPIVALDDQSAIVAGTGRGTGETIHAVRRGGQERLAAWGYEFTRRP